MKNCLGCSSALPDAFLDLGTTPLANSYVRPENAGAPERSFRLAVAYCGNCHLVQLTDLIPPEEMFSEYLYFSSYSQSYLEHAREMADSLVSRFRLGAAHRVLEVASNDGYLLQYFQQRGVRVRGVEPATNIARVAVEKGIPTDNVFFDNSYASAVRGDFGPPDLLIGNNVLAHVPSINSFLDSVRRCLASNGVAVFEFPHLLELLRACEFDTIYHEHVFYYSLWAISGLAKRAGLEVFDVESQTVHGGSLRVFLGEPGARPVSPAVPAMLAREERTGITSKSVYQRFSRKVASLKDNLLTFLGERRLEGSRVAAYGAPAKGNTLLNYCGIGADTIEFTVDRSPHKQGLLLPGSHIPIREPEALLQSMPNYTMVLPWNLASEIVSQQWQYCAQGGKFFVPIPKPAVLAPEKMGVSPMAAQMAGQTLSV